MTSDGQAPGGELPGDPDAAIRQLYSHYAKALHGYVEQFCPDRASADDIVRETFIRAWHHLPQLSADDRPVRPWLYRVGRNLLITTSSQVLCRADGRRPDVRCFCHAAAWL
jgi:RNA polymerase sigma factor (sigma-70 family)